MSEDKRRAIEALEQAGFKPNGPFRWSRPNMAKQEWVSPDTASLLPYDDGRKHLATFTLYANAEQVPTLFAPGYTAERVREVVYDTLEERIKEFRGPINAADVPVVVLDVMARLRQNGG